LAIGAAFIAIGIVLGVITVVIIYKMGNKPTTSIRLRRVNKLKSRI
jgi:hypothetical protein